MQVYFDCTFESDTRCVKSYLRENGYTLVSKRIHRPGTIIIDSITKEYSYNTSLYLGSVAVFWLFEALLGKNNINERYK